jgi:outer membrane lipoprotein LolB
MKALWRVVGCVLLLGSVSGCATFVQRVDSAKNDMWLTRRENHMADVQRWQLRGRIALRTRDEGTSANVNWRQDRQTFVVKMSGPFGRGAVMFEGDGKKALLRDGEGEIKAKTAGDLVKQRTGWHVPVENLRYWMLAMPVPRVAQTHMEFNWRGDLTRLTQNGWEIVYLEYAEVDGHRLPMKWELKHPNIQMRAAVTSWKINP